MDGVSNWWNAAEDLQNYLVRLYDLDCQEALFIQRAMQACGGIAVNNNEAGLDQVELFLSGNPAQYRKLIATIQIEPGSVNRSGCLQELALMLEQALHNYQNPLPAMEINGQTYDLAARTYVMGIINLTPDSFSGDGLARKENYIDLALEQAERMIKAGADFLDIGAESTRPGAAPIDETEEKERLLPVLIKLAKAVKVPLSVDTYKPGVAEEAFKAGATIINDIWGFKAPGDPERRMARVAATAKAGVILMHNKPAPGYRHLMKELINSLAESMEIACEAGVDLKRIIVDPGIGFAKTTQDNLRILQNLDQLKVLGRPVLLGVSRKSVVGKTLNLPVEERLEGTIAATVWGIAKGANIVRVHDVQAISRAVKMSDAILEQ